MNWYLITTVFYCHFNEVDIVVPLDVDELILPTSDVKRTCKTWFVLCRRLCREFSKSKESTAMKTTDITSNFGQTTPKTDGTASSTQLAAGSADSVP